jgi:hypothetical protein
MTRAGRLGRAVQGAVVIACAAIVGACAQDALATDSPLANAYASPEALAEAALSALAAQDDSALAVLMIERDEYETLLWPEMPDGEYTPFEFIWSQTLPPSRSARRNVQREFDGIELELVSVDLGPEDDIERYPSFTLYQDARMTVRRLDTGEQGVLPLMDALVEMDGGWKFMNYRDDS